MVRMTISYSQCFIATMLFNLHNKLLHPYHYPHLIDEETEAQRVKPFAGR